MRRIVLRLVAVAAGLTGGAAAAADPNPNLVVVSDPAAQHVVTAPVYAPRSVPNLAAPPGAAAAVGGVALAGGCASCGAKGHALGGLGIGAGCENPVTCGNWHTEKTFLWGSCRQFYSPGRDCGGHHNWFGLKNPILYGTAGLGCHDTCAYGSFNDR